MAIKYTLIDFCWLLRDAVRYSQSVEDGDCFELKTFRYLTTPNGAELTRDNMDAYPCDKNWPFFYSKLWESNGYNTMKIVGELPALFLMTANTNRGRPFERGKALKRLIIGVVDRFTDDCAKGNCSGCKGRTIPQILQDTEDVLARTLRFLANSAFYSIDGGDSYGLFNRDLITEWLNAAQITSAEEDFAFSELLYAKNQEINLETTYYDADGIYGTQTEILVEFDDCLIPDYTFDVNRFSFDR